MQFTQFSATPSIQTIPLGDLAALSVRFPEFCATIVLQGAQIIEFATRRHATNWLWLGEQVAFQRGTPIRGGVPICLPIFGKLSDNPISVQASLNHYDLPKHGDARQHIWQYQRIDQNNTHQNSTACCLSFTLPDHVAQIAPHWQILRPTLTMTLSGDGLAIVLRVTNVGDTAVSFSQALHSYFATADITHTQVTGLEGAPFFDSLTGQGHTQHGALTFAQEIDRIYRVATPLRLHTPEVDLNLVSRGSASSVLWNPWQAKARTLDQFLPDDYTRMVCIETANAWQDSVNLAAGACHTLGVMIGLA